jgi:outer membrane lipoprotein SlyB
LKTVVGLFDSRAQAEQAVKELRAKDFAEGEISLIAKDNQAARGGRGGRGGREQDFEAADSPGLGGDIADGTAWGGALGGAAGLAVGAGALAIPGIGPIVAAGPLAAALSGAVTGGLAGGLLDLGISEEEGRGIENEVRQGRTLAVVETDDMRAEEAADVMRGKGAKSTRIHDRS